MNRSGGSDSGGSQGASASRAALGGGPANPGRCETTYDLFRLLRTFAVEHGFQWFIVIAEPPRANVTLSEITMITNWQPELLRAYDHARLIETSPVVEWMKRPSEPLFWTLDTLIARGSAELAEPTRRLFEEFGHGAGVLFPVFSADATRGAVGFSAERMPGLDGHQVMEMAWTSSGVFNRLWQIEQMVSPARTELTVREIECIRWIAAGKSSAEAAAILGISPHTVDHYLATAGRKLNTVNRAHTVAMALRLRLLR
ncbi:MAG: transcriptional regulator [Alphaproteobacteria bacterium]|nr:MAG: transcriptional regulator [Alphaproteobacteria bacterium]